MTIGFVKDDMLGVGAFLNSHFDKLLLSFFILYFSLLGFHAVYILELHKIEINNPIVQSFMSAMLDNQKLVIGALLGLITGRALSGKNGGSNVTTATSSATNGSISSSTSPKP